MLTVTAKQHSIDVIIVSEPYLKEVKKLSWISDYEGSAALKLTNPKVILKGTGSGRCFAWMELKNMVISSCYFSPNIPMEAFTDSLDELVRRVYNFRLNIISVQCQSIEMGDDHTRS